MKERLQKLLAQANIGSRRASEELISAGRVRVNGKAAQLGDKADPAADVIEVDGARLKFDAQPHKYIMLNKPKQVLSTDKPHRGDRRDTIMDLIGLKEHLFSIGRLDADSEGMIVMTNDGDLAQKLSHPRYRHTKTYRVEVHGLPTAETLDKWRQGVFLEDGRTAPCFVEITHGSVRGSILRVIMTEGKKRQIRRVASLLGHPVSRLIRTHIGMLSLGELEVGKWRELTAKEVMLLRASAPEGKSLRATPRRIAPAVAPEADDVEKPHVPRRAASADETGEKRRSPRARVAESADEPGEKRRSPRTRTSAASEDAPPKRRISRAAASEDAPAKRRTPRTRTSDATEDVPEKRRAPRTRTSDTTEDVPEKRRISRVRAAESDDSQPKRRTPRARTSDTSDEASDKRRTPRIRKLEAEEDVQNKPRTPRTRTSATLGKRRIPRARTADTTDTGDEAVQKPRTPRARTNNAPDASPDKRKPSRAPRGKKSVTPANKRRKPTPAGARRSPSSKKPRGGRKDQPR